MRIDAISIGIDPPREVKRIVERATELAIAMRIGLREFEPQWASVAA